MNETKYNAGRSWKLLNDYLKGGGIEGKTARKLTGQRRIDLRQEGKLKTFNHWFVAAGYNLTS